VRVEIAEDYKGCKSDAAAALARAVMGGDGEGKMTSTRLLRRRTRWRLLERQARIAAAASDARIAAAAPRSLREVTGRMRRMATRQLRCCKRWRP
jgi:hypothetical protein